MQKTDNFFLIHNYNTVPTDLTEYCENYIIYDCSDKDGVRDELKAKGLKYIEIPNTGHNITSYFNYFIDNYDSLPEVIDLLKGNIIGRHLTKEYFDKVYGNTYFTYLYENKGDRKGRVKSTDPDEKEDEISFLINDNIFCEKNTSWYVQSPDHPHWYFDDFDDLLRFIYNDPVVPRWNIFAPGACYIVRREQILKNTPEFYANLNKLMNYDRNPNFPSEAHQVERLLPTIFNSSYEVNPWMNDEDAFDEKLKERRELMLKKEEWNSKRLKRLRKLLGQKPPV